MDSYDVHLLYTGNKKAAARHNGEISEWMSIKPCLRQGYVASPHLFALYTEMIMRSLEDKGGFRISGRVINNLRYAYDTVILVETEHELQHLMDIVVQESEQKGLFLNIAKSYTIVFNNTSSIPTCQINVHRKPLEQVNSFVYLGSVFTYDGRCEKEVKRRIGITKTAFTSMKKVVCGRNISIPVRLRVLKCYIWSTMLYGCETWALSKGMMNNLEAAEHWFLGRILRISWTDKVSTCEVFRRAGVGKRLMQDMICRQMTFLRRVIRKDELEKVVLTGYVEGTRDRGKQRETLLTYLSKHKGIQPSEMIRQAIDRDMWIQV